MIIAKKLGAEQKNKKKRAKHEVWLVVIENERSARFNIRHSKSDSNWHLVNQLKLSETKLKKLVDCTMSKEEWLETYLATD